MNEWGVIGVLIVLVGFGSAIIGPILKLNTAIVKLTDAVKELQKDMGDFVNGNHASHVRIHERIDSCNIQLKDQEMRLGRLEADR